MMNAFWIWLYDQLERKPSEKEAELLKSALDDTVEAPSGKEPLQSARLLQSRIGNRAFQQLLQMKAVQSKKAQQNNQQPGQVEEARTVAPGMPEQETEIPPREAPPTPAAVLHATENEPPQQTKPADKEDLESKDLQQLARQVEKKAEPTAEEKLAGALSAFIVTLQRGGGAPEWLTLSRMFTEAPPQSREEVLKTISALFAKLEPIAQRAFVKKLMQWRRSQDDQLAALLWLRLSPTTPGAASKAGSQGGDGNGEGNN